MKRQGNRRWAVTLSEAKGLASRTRFFASLRMTLFGNRAQFGCAGLAATLVRE
jgi:hypothetical protein